MTIHLWLLPIDQNLIPPIEILSDAEKRRYERALNPKKRSELLYSRLLLRAALCTFYPDAPQNTIAVPDEHDRPFWESGGKRLPLYFSLSHTKQMVALAVGKSKEIGCDIEQIRPVKYEKELVEKVFGQEEQNNYTTQSDEAAAQTFFFKSWTLKEAYVKAIGTGMRTPLSSLDFTHLITPAQSVVEVQSQKWYFYNHMEEEYALSLATTKRNPEIELREKNVEELLVACQVSDVAMSCRNFGFLRGTNEGA